MGPRTRGFLELVSCVLGAVRGPPGLGAPMDSGHLFRGPCPWSWLQPAARLPRLHANVLFWVLAAVSHIPSVCSAFVGWSVSPGLCLYVIPHASVLFLWPEGQCPPLAVHLFVSPAGFPAASPALNPDLPPRAGVLGALLKLL